MMLDLKYTLSTSLLSKKILIPSLLYLENILKANWSLIQKKAASCIRQKIVE